MKIKIVGKTKVRFYTDRLSMSDNVYKPVYVKDGEKGLIMPYGGRTGSFFYPLKYLEKDDEGNYCRTTRMPEELSNSELERKQRYYTNMLPELDEI